MTTKRTPPPSLIMTRSKNLVTTTPPVVNDAETSCKRKRLLDGVYDNEEENLAQEPMRLLENKIDELLKIVKNSNDICVALSKDVSELMAVNSKLRDEIAGISKKKEKNEELCSMNCEAIQQSNMSVINCMEQAKNAINKSMSANPVVAPVSTKLSFANIVKESFPVVVLKPKDPSKSNESTKAELRKAINPNGIQIKNVRNTKNGGIAIECKTSDALEKLQTDATSLLGADFNITVPQKRVPKVKVLGISEITDDVVENLLTQNDHIFNTNSKVKIVHTFEIKNRQTFGFKMEMDGESFERLMRTPKLRIGWDICGVYEELDINRCFNCSEFHHLQKDCKKKTACPRCSGPHPIRECTSTELSCPNCKRASSELHMKIDTNHEAWDSICPVYQRKVDLARKRVDYGKRPLDDVV